MASNNALKMFKFNTNGIVPPDPQHPHSLRTTRASWTGAKRAAKDRVDLPEEKLDLRRNGARVIMFCLGGLVYSELRSLYEVARDSQRSTFVYNAGGFVDILKKIHMPEIIAPLAKSVSTDVLVSQPSVKIEKEKKGIFGKFK